MSRSLLPRPGGYDKMLMLYFLPNQLGSLGELSFNTVQSIHSWLCFSFLSLGSAFNAFQVFPFIYSAAQHFLLRKQFETNDSKRLPTYILDLWGKWKAIIDQHFLLTPSDDTIFS